MEYRFPKNFFWGTATSSHQIEGNNTKNDWWKAEQAGDVPYKSGLACDSYNRYSEDFDLAQKMHNNAHRFSIEWSRIEPTEGKFDEREIEHYRHVIGALRKRGMEPFVTLHHFTNPVWFADKGGWTNKKAPEYFGRYVRYVVRRLGSEVNFWITINEPLIVNSQGYLSGHWPPFHKRNFFGFMSATRHMVSAHKHAYDWIHSMYPNSQVGIAKSNVYFEAYKNRPLSRIIRLLADHLWNKRFLNKIKKHQDFIGLNYYSHNRIHVRISRPHNWFMQNENKEVSDFGWEIYPQGLYHTVRALKKYKKPIYITENGIADARDRMRPRFIKEHLRALARAINEGVDVRGYFYWSLMDNFEWREGFGQRFGLVEIDFKTQERKPRASYDAYKEICKSNTVNFSAEGGSASG